MNASEQEKKQAAILGGFVAVAVIAAHWAMLGRHLVFDDVLILRDIASRGAWHLFQPDTFGFVRPGKVMLFSLLWSLFGENSFGYQAFCLLVLIGLCLSFLRLAREFLPPRGALVAALVMAVHPYQVEGAGWLSAVNGSIMVLFAIQYYLSVLHARGPGGRDALVMAGWAVAAVFMKEDAVVLPLVAGVMLWFRGVRITFRWAGNLSLHLALIFAFIAYNRMTAANMGQVLEDFPYDTWIISLAAPRAILAHFAVFAWPFRWNYYEFFGPHFLRFFGFLFVGMLAAASFAAVLWRQRRRVSPPVFFLLIAILAILPVSNLLPMGNNPFGLRYLTHSGLGLCLLAGWLYEAAATTRWARAVQLGYGAWLVAAVVASSLFHFGWGANERLFRNLTTRIGAAWHWNERAKLAFQRQDYAESEAMARTALAVEKAENQQMLADRKWLESMGLRALAPIDRERAVYRVMLGMALYKQGRRAEALSWFQDAQRVKPADTDANLNLGNYYDDEYSKNRDPQHRLLADRFYATASDGRGTGAVSAFINRGTLWASDGETSKAVEIWTKGLERFPQSRAISHNLQYAKKQLEKQAGQNR